VIQQYGFYVGGKYPEEKACRTTGKYYIYIEQYFIEDFVYTISANDIYMCGKPSLPGKII
jgi:hypothetical protein